MAAASSKGGRELGRREGGAIFTFIAERAQMVITKAISPPVNERSKDLACLSAYSPGQVGGGKNHRRRHHPL